MSTQKVRLGVVGIGFGQSVHVPAFRRDPRAEIVAICASSLARAEPVARRLGIPQAFGDFRALVASPDIDAVSISVPPNLQPDVVLEAARHGKHLFCEKPLGLSAAHARAMVQAARDAGVVHAVDFEFAELGSWRRAKELLSRQALGALRHVAMSWRVETRARREGFVSWKQQGEMGGGALSNFAAHDLYCLRWLVGTPRRLAARLAPSHASADARVDVWLEWESDVTGVLSVATDAFRGGGHRLEVYGDAGSLRLENATDDHLRNFVLSFAARDAGESQVQSDERVAGAEDGRIAPVSRLATRFLDAIEVGSEVHPNLEDGLAVQVLLDACRASHRSGTWQTL